MNHKIMLKASLLFGLFILVSIMPLHNNQAQEDPLCPADVLLALARSASTCFSMERNQACYANGNARTTFYPSVDDTVDVAFSMPGDIVDLTHLSQLDTMASDGSLSVATIRTQASLTDLEERNVTIMLIGDATVINEVTPTPSLIVTATGSLNIRQTPETDGEIVDRIAINQTLVANGIDEEGNWLRVEIPNTDLLGWASAEVVTSATALETLAVVDIDTPYLRPFELFSIETGEATFCDGALQSGVLLQTPNTFTDVTLTINDVDIALSATTFLQAQGQVLTINVLDGYVEVNESIPAIYVPAGAQTMVDLRTGVASAAIPYDIGVLRGLPINNLPGRMVLAEPLTPEAIETLIAERNAAEAEENTEEANVIEEDTTCRRVVNQPTTLWAGPGVFYEAINELETGDSVRPILQTTDAEGEIWWQMRSSNWIRASRVEQTGECDPIPVVDQVQPPRTNTLSLETCESSNGPLRVGQVVIIEFKPPPWNNYGDARDAVRIDPGVITIDSREFPVYASDPIRLGTVDERYLRIFRTTWTATGGAHRIEAERLSYIAICNITVPFG